MYNYRDYTLLFVHAVTYFSRMAFKLVTSDGSFTVTIIAFRGKKKKNKGRKIRTESGESTTLSTAASFFALIPV